MNNHFPLLIGALLASIFCSPAAAQTTPDPFKGANVIVLQVSEHPALALSKLARCFVEQGYTLAQIDTTIGYFATAPRTVGEITPADFTYRVVSTPKTKGTELRLTGRYAVRAGMQIITPSMHWFKGNLTQDKQCFLRADQAAHAYLDAQLSYERQPD